MCFPCWKYEDVHFEERPKLHKVNKHPHTGTVYAGYYAPRPMVPAHLPGVVVPPPMVPIPRPIVPALLPVGPATGPATITVSNRTIFLGSDSSPNSQFLLSTSRSLPYQSSLGCWSHRFTHRMPLAQLHKRNSYVFDFLYPQHSPKHRSLLTTQSPRVTCGLVYRPLPISTSAIRPQNIDSTFIQRTCRIEVNWWSTICFTSAIQHNITNAASHFQRRLWFHNWHLSHLWQQKRQRKQRSQRSQQVQQNPQAFSRALPFSLHIGTLDHIYHSTQWQLVLDRCF